MKNYIVSKNIMGNKFYVKLKFRNGYGVGLHCKNFEEPIHMRKFAIEILDFDDEDFSATSYLNPLGNPIFRNYTHNATIDLLMSIQQFPEKRVAIDMAV